MEYLYIDESGSMTNQYVRNNPYFVIAVIRSKHQKRLGRLHKRFVQKHMIELAQCDRADRMFRENKFQELKGSALTPDLKRAFVSYFCRQDTLEIYYIIIDNKSIHDHFYDNTARAFNYVLKLGLEYFITKGYLPDDQYIIQLDERNERTETKYFLKNYLNTEFRLRNIISQDVRVQYFDSAANRFIQVADVFANLQLSNLHTKEYNNEFQEMRGSGCLKCCFHFP